ncbi:hypothetical protein [Vagococcus salmoninarum]|uniref:hypothetical protein n=1 Tax=Vagococcus salmoninarum TaxID=2739 RepID=UPI003F9DA14A
MKKLTVGFVTTLSGRWPNELPEQRLREYNKWLEVEYPDINYVHYPEIANTTERVNEVINQFKQVSVDLVIMLYGAFTGDDVSCALAEELGVPLILWAPEEPPFERDERLLANALVAATMNAASLHRLQKKAYVIYGNKEDVAVQAKLKSLITTYQAVRQMKGTLLGLFGYRPTAFYNSAFDEGLIRRTFGIRIEETDLKMVFDRMAEIAKPIVEKDIDYMTSTYQSERLPVGHLENHSRLFYALQELIAEEGYDYSTIKCWPEMGKLKTTPCAAIGRLSDLDTHIVCEGDVDAAISTIAHHTLTGLPTFITDLINIDKQDNLLTFWHCGQAAPSLLDQDDGILMADHPLAGQGVAFYGALKPGKVTISRFCNIGGKYKLFIMVGEAIKTKRQTCGVMVNVKIAQDVETVIEKIIAEGVPHHYSIVWQDVLAEMTMLADVLGIEVIAV